MRKLIPHRVYCLFGFHRFEVIGTELTTGHLKSFLPLVRGIRVTGHEATKQRCIDCGKERLQL